MLRLKPADNISLAYLLSDQAMFLGSMVELAKNSRYSASEGPLQWQKHDYQDFGIP
jgi:hypothetical protein